MRFLHWVKRLFKKPAKPSHIEETFTRVQEKLIAQELALLKPTTPQRRVIPRMTYAEWKENNAAVQRYFARTA